MYMLTEVEKVVRIPPKDLKDDIDSVIDTRAALERTRTSPC